MSHVVQEARGHAISLPLGPGRHHHASALLHLRAFSSCVVHNQRLSGGGDDSRDGAHVHDAQRGAPHVSAFLQLQLRTCLTWQRAGRAALRCAANVLPFKLQCHLY